MDETDKKLADKALNNASNANATCLENLLASPLYAPNQSAEMSLASVDIARKTGEALQARGLEKGITYAYSITPVLEGARMPPKSYILRVKVNS